MTPICRRVKSLLLRGAFSGNPRLVGMCRELYDHRRWLWTFLQVEAIEPTNNASERALRQAVIWRKLSFGAQSAAGSRFVETILTVVETCLQQSRNAFASITSAVDAPLPRQSAPSLLAGV
jgi:transposase